MLMEKNYLKKLVFILVFLMLSISCFGQSIDNRLNGTWVRPLESFVYDESLNDFVDLIIESILIFNNGAFSGGTSSGGATRGSMTMNGTYTTSAGKIIIQYTFSNSLFNVVWNYIINNNILTITDEENETSVYTRKD